MIIAAIRPYSSEAGSSNSPKISPPYSIVSPSMAMSSSSFCTSSEKSRISVWSRSVMLTWAKAIVPSGLIWLGWSYGLVTATPSIASTSAKMLLHRRLDLGVVDPLFGPSNTIWPGKPAASGLTGSSWSITSADSESGNVKSVLNAEPAAPAATLTPTRIGTQIAKIVIHLCVTHQRASRASMTSEATQWV